MPAYKEQVDMARTALISAINEKLTETQVNQIYLAARVQRSTVQKREGLLVLKETPKRSLANPKEKPSKPLKDDLYEQTHQERLKQT